MKPVDSRALHRLIAAVQKEMEKLRELKTEHTMLSPETSHQRVIGSILHDFYTGIERVFQKIATELEGRFRRVRPGTRISLKIWRLKFMKCGPQ